MGAASGGRAGQTPQVQADVVPPRPVQLVWKTGARQRPTIFSGRTHASNCSALT
jgi:hypothetical protein